MKDTGIMRFFQFMNDSEYKQKSHCVSFSLKIAFRNVKHFSPTEPTVHAIQSNLNSTNIDGSIPMDNSNLFLSPYEILPTTQENRYVGNCSYFIMKLYVVFTH